MKAVLKNYRQSPRKIRLIAGVIKGKSYAEADAELAFLIKRGALPIRQLLASAAANAVTNFGLEKENLFVKEIRVDKGVVLKRSTPRAFGRASRINKRSSHVVITLAERPVKAKKAAKTKTVKKEKVTKTKADAK